MKSTPARTAHFVFVFFLLFFFGGGGVVVVFSITVYNSAEQTTLEIQRLQVEHKLRSRQDMIVSLSLEFYSNTLVLVGSWDMDLNKMSAKINWYIYDRYLSEIHNRGRAMLLHAKKNITNKHTQKNKQTNDLFVVYKVIFPFFRY